MVDGQHHNAAVLLPGGRPYSSGASVGCRAGLKRRGKSRRHRE